MKIKLILTLLFLLSFGCNTSCSAETTKVTILPLVDSAYVDGSSSGEYTGYNYKEILTNSYNNKITSLLTNKLYVVTNESEMNNAIISLGYDIENMDSLSKNDIITIGEKTDSDITLYIEALKFTNVEGFSNHFYASFKCAVYDKKTSRFVSFRINNNLSKSGSVFNSQKARSKKNAAIFIDDTFDKIFNRIQELGFNL